MKNRRFILSGILVAAIFILGLLGGCSAAQEKEPVDYVNPYMGNISHLLVPTYPTVHLPNGMMRIHPLRKDYTDNKVKGLPVFLAGHRASHAFSIGPSQGESSLNQPVINYDYDNEKITPYSYQVYLDNVSADIYYVPSYQSAMYKVGYEGKGTPCLIISSEKGEVAVQNNSVSAWQPISDSIGKVYLYLETDCAPVDNTVKKFDDYQSLIMQFKTSDREIKVRYGISLISVEQAKRNLRREIVNYDIDSLAVSGRNVWNKVLGKIEVKGSSEEDKAVFYTSLYRVYERPVNISEDGKYFSGFDGQVHEDNGIPFYTDDWIWDTYRATHPLRVIIDSKKEVDIVNSLVRMAEQNDDTMPTFPDFTGDTHRMNGNHGVAVVLDCYEKGLCGFDLSKAYEVCKNAITEKTLAPWSDKRGGSLDKFFKENGYFPALDNGEEETVPEVHGFEKRQPVAVTLGTVYDEWCLGNLARHIGNDKDAAYFLDRSYNYRKVFNSATKFFHPKNSEGDFIEPFDYRYSGGLGARDAYCENNGWIYRWDVPHNINDLIMMMGGRESFIGELEKMYDTPLGKAKYKFYAGLPDHTGNVGMFSMGNEPAFHVPYLYNYAGEPWRTQKRVRSLLTQWFRDDLMGVPGDEDGGGMSAFVVFSQLGFYPVTPGLPIYVIGSPVFKEAVLHVDNNKVFRIICRNYAPENKYIQSVRLNGKEWNKSWFHHDDLVQGGEFEFIMGKRPNKQWASAVDAIPPSFEIKN